MSCTIDTRGFLGAMDAAARYIGAGVATEAALRPEIGKVLERAVQYTKAPGEEDLRRRTEYGLTRKFNTYAAGDVGVVARRTTPRISRCTGTGKNWWVDLDKHGNRKFYLMNGGPRKNWGNRYARYLAEEQDRAADLALELQEYLPKVMASRGLTKQSWVQIGKSLGIAVDAPGYVKAALASDGRDHLNGFGQRIASEDKLIFQLENLMPTLTSPRRPEEKLAGARILQASFDTREKAIMIAIEKGIFDDLEAALKRFPGVALLR